MDDDYPRPTVPSKPGSRQFQKARTPMPPATAERQGRITQLALAHLGGREEVMSFLNLHHAKLSGRPLDLAMESAEGFARVEREIIGASVQ